MIAVNAYVASLSLNDGRVLVAWLAWVVVVAVLVAIGVSWWRDHKGKR